MFREIISKIKLVWQVLNATTVVTSTTEDGKYSITIIVDHL